MPDAIECPIAPVRFHFGFPHVFERAEAGWLEAGLPADPRVPQLADSLFPALAIYPLAGEDV